MNFPSREVISATVTTWRNWQTWFRGMSCLPVHPIAKNCSMRNVLFSLQGFNPVGPEMQMWFSDANFQHMEICVLVVINFQSSWRLWKRFSPTLVCNTSCSSDVRIKWPVFDSVWARSKNLVRRRIPVVVYSTGAVSRVQECFRPKHYFLFDSGLHPGEPNIMFNTMP